MSDRVRAGRGLPAYRPARSPLMSMGPSLDDERRRHRVARLVAVSSVAAVVVIVLLVWGIGLLGREVVQTDVTQRTGIPAVALPGGGTGANVPVQAAGRPSPQLLAEAVVEPGEPGLRLQLPIRRESITGIGYAPRREPGVIELEPTGHRANLSWARRAAERFLSTRPAGDLRWFRLADGAPSMVTIGAAPTTEVYAPIDGRVVAISDHEIGGQVRGQIIQLQPLGDGQTVLVMRNLDAASELAVGNTVSEGATRLGYVRDMAGSIDAPLSTYTHDTGSGIDMYVLRVELETSQGL
ncbi:MAG: hypothetical protein JWM90_2042 [Thermoleophilia bacterium]|nr:hypothetical protein [Thermoleophilia bacterium]